MSKLPNIKRFLVICLITMGFGVQVQAQPTPDKEQFLIFWSFFKSAIKANDAAFIKAHMHFPFESGGAWYNQEATVEEVIEHYKEVLPPYKRAMDFVKFDIVLVENENAYVWLGYSEEEQAYFYAYKKLDDTGYATASTYQEKYYFKLFGKEYRFYKTTSGLSGDEEL